MRHGRSPGASPNRLTVGALRLAVAAAVPSGGLVPAWLLRDGTARVVPAAIMFLVSAGVLVAILTARGLRGPAGLGREAVFGTVVLSAGVSLGVGAGCVGAALWSSAWWAGAPFATACLMALRWAAAWELLPETGPGRSGSRSWQRYGRRDRPGRTAVVTGWRGTVDR